MAVSLERCMLTVISYSSVVRTIHASFEWIVRECDELLLGSIGYS